MPFPPLPSMLVAMRASIWMAGLTGVKAARTAAFPTGARTLASSLAVAPARVARRVRIKKTSATTTTPVRWARYASRTAVMIFNAASSSEAAPARTTTAVRTPTTSATSRLAGAFERSQAAATIPTTAWRVSRARTTPAPTDAYRAFPSPIVHTGSRVASSPRINVSVVGSPARATRTSIAKPSGWYVATSKATDRWSAWPRSIPRDPFAFRVQTHNAYPMSPRYASSPSRVPGRCADSSGFAARRQIARTTMTTTAETSGAMAEANACCSAVPVKIPGSAQTAKSAPHPDLEVHHPV